MAALLAGTALTLAACETVDNDAPAGNSATVPGSAATPGYPSLHSVPARPDVGYDRDLQRGIVAGLIADRENARYSNQVLRYRTGRSGLPPPDLPPAAAASSLTVDDLIPLPETKPDSPLYEEGDEILVDPRLLEDPLDPDEDNEELREDLALDVERSNGSLAEFVRDLLDLDDQDDEVLAPEAEPPASAPPAGDLDARSDPPVRIVPAAVVTDRATTEPVPPAVTAPPNPNGLAGYVRSVLATAQEEAVASRDAAPARADAMPSPTPAATTAVTAKPAEDASGLNQGGLASLVRDMFAEATGTGAASVPAPPSPAAIGDTPPPISTVAAALSEPDEGPLFPDVGFGVIDFAPGSDVLPPDAPARLAALLAAAEGAPGTIKVVGEADEPALAIHRARAVGLALVRLGVQADDIELSMSRDAAGDLARLELLAPKGS